MINIDGHNFIEENGIIGSFVITGNNLQNEIKYIIDNNINSIYLSHFNSHKIENLDFLNEISFIECININDLNLSYEPILKLNRLKKAILSINKKEQKIDFSQFSNLESLSCDWYEGFPDLINNKKLNELRLWKFNPKSKSLNSLKLPKTILKLHLNQTNISDLNGFESIFLEEFECYYCRNLISLDGIANFSEGIKTIIIENAKNLTNYLELIRCCKLNKLILTNCGEVENISWIKHLQNLKHFAFWGTNIIDGDLSLCFNIEYVSFNNKKHYNYKDSDFNNPCCP